MIEASPLRMLSGEMGGGISVDNLPVVKYAKNEFTPEPDIPVLYGDGIFVKDESHIDCGIDVFASIFFMLTRWEEYVIKRRDKWNRFNGKDSVAFKAGFLHRPIVNEYVEMIWNMMLYLGYSGKRKPRRFEVVPTHDIDKVFMRRRFVDTAKTVVKRSLALDIRDAIFFSFDFLRDPYNTFNFLMKTSEETGVNSRFYFMSADGAIDRFRDSPFNSKRYQTVIKQIRKRGHYIGFHPGFFSVEKEQNWHKEKKMYEEYLGFTPEEGRQHYLRFNMPETFSFWEHNDMKLDSTLTYYDVEGFRCGTGDIFHVFNFLERKEYELVERPLVIMDGTLLDYQSYPLNKVVEVLDYYISIGKKYKMPITLLFHNSVFEGYQGYKLKKIYRNCLNKCKAS